MAWRLALQSSTTLSILHSAPARLGAALACAVIALCQTPAAHAFLVSAEVLAPPSYATLPPPPAGQSYQDPVFSTSILRVTDAAAMEDTIGGGALEFVMHEYSTISPFNLGTTHMLLQHESVYALYDSSGRLLQVLPADIHASSEPRWSLHQPSIFFYIDGNELRIFDIATGESALVRKFEEYGEISGRGENDLSADGGHFALVGDGHEIFLYEWSTNTKGAALDARRFGSFDQVMVTPDNQVLVGWNAVGPGRGQGLELFDGNMAFMKQVSRAAGHMDLGRDFDGAQVVVRSNAADPDPICENGVVKIRLGDEVQTCLLSLDWSLAVHVSMPDVGPWIVVSTFAPADPTPDAGWALYTNEILQVSLDGAEVRRLAHHRSRPVNEYNYQPRAATSRDGSRILYSSNFSLQSLAGFGQEYSEVFLIGGEPQRPRRHRRAG
jgi:hypothetical protein